MQSPYQRLVNVFACVWRTAVTSRCVCATTEDRRRDDNPSEFSRLT